MKYLLIIFAFFTSLSLPAQEYGQVDNYVQELQIDKELSIESTVDRIIKPFNEDLDKTRALYYWLASNIAYDYEGYKSGFWKDYQSHEEIINDTFKFRKGICSGYSHLFKYMLKLSDIQSKVISGYARTDLQTIFLNETNHAWNKVKINNSWHLIDVTWARDTTNNRVNDFYFMTDPELFILNHYPEDYNSALLDKEYTLQEYMDFPIYTNSYHELKLTQKISTDGQFNANNDTVTINLKPEIECVLLPIWYDIENGEWIKVQMGELERREESFSLYVPRKSDFILQLGVLTQTDSSFTIFDRVVYYKVTNK